MSPFVIFAIPLHKQRDKKISTSPGENYGQDVLHGCVAGPIQGSVLSRDTRQIFYIEQMQTELENKDSFFNWK